MSQRAWVDGVSFHSATWRDGRLEVTALRDGVSLSAEWRKGCESERTWQDAETTEVLSLGLCRAISAIVPGYVYETIGRHAVDGIGGVTTWQPSEIGGDRGVYSVRWSPS